MFRRLVSLEEAETRIAEAFVPRPLGAEQVALMETVGRVLAEDVVSPVDVPPFSRSTVDGYAVRAGDTFGAEENKPVILRVAGSAVVGELPNLVVKKGETVEIVTGAPLPRGAEAVVMAEHASEEEQGQLLVHKAVVKGENVMAKGSDIHGGEVVLKRGVVLSSRELGVLSALGFTEARVFKRPRVAVLSTGAEIVEPGTPLPPGKIFDINTSTLTAATLENGGQPVRLDVVHDDVKSLKRALRKAVDVADMVVTSGGVSVGPKDIIPKILDELGEQGLVVHGIAVKPGKPVAFAVVKGIPVFSLPGHPTSALLMFQLLVRPMLLTMAGRGTPQPPHVKAVLTQKLFPARGRRTFVMVTLSLDKTGRWQASQVHGGESGAITTLAKANGYVELKETQQFIAAGSEVTVVLLRALPEQPLL